MTTEMHAAHHSTGCAVLHALFAASVKDKYRTSNRTKLAQKAPAEADSSECTPHIQRVACVPQARSTGETMHTHRAPPGRKQSLQTKQCTRVPLTTVTMPAGTPPPNKPGHENTHKSYGVCVYNQVQRALDSPRQQTVPAHALSPNVTTWPNPTSHIPHTSIQGGRQDQPRCLGLELKSGMRPHTLVPRCYPQGSHGHESQWEGLEGDAALLACA